MTTDRSSEWNERPSEWREPPPGWTGPTPEELARTAGQRFAQAVESGEIVLFGEPTGQPVVLQPYATSWADEFENLRRRLADALGATAVRIDHVGSTSVPGLLAKPTIDIQVSVPDVEDEDAYRRPIEDLGFPMRARENGHRYFRTIKGVERRVHVHVCAVGSEWERDHLLFRDYLRAHPDAAGRYGALKAQLAARYADDRLAYTEGKTPFIRSVVASAESWAREIGWRP